MCGSRALYIVFFFFSSRRRHTRFDCDWSSDVCSSDLAPEGQQSGRTSQEHERATVHDTNVGCARGFVYDARRAIGYRRSEEHTSELQSQSNLVCRLLLEKKTHTSRITSIPAIAAMTGD